MLRLRPYGTHARGNVTIPTQRDGHDTYQVTDVTRVAHRMNERDMTAGRASGRYLSLCGRRVLPADLNAQEYAQCPACAEGSR